MIQKKGRRMVRAFQRGLGSVVGYVLPLQYGSWKSGPWTFRSSHLYLLPGDSPAGLRLPLDSLPWVAPEDLPKHYALDPMAAREQLPDLHDQRTASTTISAETTGAPSSPNQVR